MLTLEGKLINRQESVNASSASASKDISSTMNMCLAVLVRGTSDRFFVRADHRRAEEAAEIRALAAQRLQFDQACFDGTERAFGFGEIEQRRRIGPRDLGQHRILLCQAVLPCRWSRPKPVVKRAFPDAYEYAEAATGPRNRAPSNMAT